MFPSNPNCKGLLPAFFLLFLGVALNVQTTVAQTFTLSGTVADAAGKGIEAETALKEVTVVAQKPFIERCSVIPDSSFLIPINLPIPQALSASGIATPHRAPKQVADW